MKLKIGTTVIRKSITVVVPIETANALRAYCESIDRSVNWFLNALIRRAIREKPFEQQTSKGVKK